MNYILYARKSTDTEDKQVLSLESQIQELELLAKKAGIKIIEIITESKSAKEPGRPEFNRMMDMIEAKKADAIITWKLDRLARNPVDGGRVSWLLQNGVIKQIQTNSHLYLPKDNVLLMSVEFGLSNQYIRDLSENVSRGMLTKIKSGWFIGKAPFGYLNNPIKNAAVPIIEDPERFKMVRKIWDLMLSGVYTAPQVMEKFNAQYGIRTLKRGKEGGKLLTRSKIYWILNNPFYYGAILYKGEIFQGKHKPMVSVDEFEGVQKILGSEGRPRAQVRKFAYTGMVRCGECGGMITAEKKAKPAKSGGVLEYTYYHCTKRKVGIKCGQAGIREKELEKQISKKLADITIDEDFKNFTIKWLRILHADEVKDRSVIHKQLQKEYNGVQGKLDGLLDMRMQKLISNEEYLAAKSEPIKEKVRVGERLQDSDHRADSWIDVAERTFNFAAYAKERFRIGTLEEKKIIFTALGSNFILKDKKLDAKIRLPFIKVKECLSRVEAEAGRLELLQSGVQSGEGVPVLSQNSSWWSVLDHIRTFFQSFQSPIIIPNLNFNHK
ncbi:MAG: recombinase family protein [Candidatus Omnitrophica bacterium]|nr:recombinase family protein [Candidatus Omnitrophota bacterium]